MDLEGSTLSRRMSARMSCIEKWRAEIVVVVVLPISLVIWLFKKAKRCATYPNPTQHSTRVLRVAAAVREAADTRQLLRTDRSVYESHSVRNSDKTAARLITLRDFRAILGVHPCVCARELIGLRFGLNRMLLFAWSRAEPEQK